MSVDLFCVGGGGGGGGDIDDIDDIDGRDMNIRCFLSVVSVSFF